MRKNWLVYPPVGGQVTTQPFTDPDWVRGKVTVRLVAVLCFLCVVALSASLIAPDNVTKDQHVIDLVLATLSGLTGVAFGFYFSKN